MILVVGDVVTDVLAVVREPIHRDSDTPAEIRVAGGGAGANAAAWLAAAGARVRLCGVVGADEAGDVRLAELAAGGVDLAVRRDPAARTGCIVVLTGGPERTMLTDRGANLRLRPDDVDEAIGAGVTHVHVSGYALLDAESRPAARHALAIADSVTTSVDAASAGPLRRVGGDEFLSWVRGTDVLFANADEARALLGPGAPVDPAEMARELTAYTMIAVVKLGAGGALAVPSGGEVTRVAAPPAEAVDTTGAGDAFAAGFLTEWTRTRDVAGALAAGAALGARAVSRVGGRP